MKVKKVMKEIHQNSLEHGFWEDYKNIKNSIEDVELMNKSRKLGDKLEPTNEKAMLNNAICTRLMLIVGEVSEAMEGLRKEDMPNFKEEIADIIIRTFDLAEGLNIDLEVEIEKKMAINKDREYMHGKAF